MEGYARHSRPHYKKSHTPTATAATAASNTFPAYSDVFGGPPKFGATPLAPRADEYSEIFSGFHPGRASSIPMLDLPPVVDSFDALRCTAFDYSEIFGGFEFSDFAVPYDELFRRSNVSDDSSDDAWTPVGTGSLSEESDQYAYSGRNQFFVNGEFDETFEDNVFSVSYNQVYMGTREDSELIHEAQVSSVPGYAYVVEGSSVRKEEEERYSSGVADDIILCEDSSGNVSVETPWNTASIQFHGCTVEKSDDFDKKAEGADGFGLHPSFISVSDVSLRSTNSSHSAPPSRLAPAIGDNKNDPSSSVLDYGHSNMNTADTISEGGSLDLFDVELNSGPSSITSATAMKEAMDRAKVKFDTAEELTKGKKDGVKDMPVMNNDLNMDEKVKMVFDESILRDDEQKSTHARESNISESYCGEMQDASEVSQALPGSLQPEYTVNGAAEPAQRKTAMNTNLYLDPGLSEGDGKWKLITECYELGDNCNSKIEPSLPDNVKKPEQETDNYHFSDANGITMSARHLNQNMEKVDSSVKEDEEDSQSSDEVYAPRENRWRPRATKAASRNVFHEKMVKVAQDVHEIVISGHVETVKKEKEVPEGDECYLAGNEFKSEDNLVWEETLVAAMEETLETVKEIAGREDNGRRLNDAYKTEKEEEACARKDADAMKWVLSSGDGNLCVLSEALEQKEGGGESRRSEKQDRDVRFKKSDEESSDRENEMWENEAQKAYQCKKNVEGAIMMDYCSKKRNGSFEPGNYEKHGVDVSVEEMEQFVLASELEFSPKIYDYSAMNEKKKMESKGDLQAQFKITEHYSDEEANMEMESEYFSPIGTSTLDETDYIVPGRAYECDELKASKLTVSLDEKDIISTAMCESEEKLKNQAAEDLPMDEEKTQFGSRTLFGEMEVTDMADLCLPTKYLPKAEAEESMMSGWEGNGEDQFQSVNTYQIVGKEAKVTDGDLNAVAREHSVKLKIREEYEREHLRELHLEKERGREREFEEERLKKLEEEERESELEKERLRKLEEERERELEKERLRKLEEERERELEEVRLRKLEEERERKLEKERLRNLEEERERELEKERLRKLEEERERELEKEGLRKLEEELEKERRKELEKLRLRRLEELREREREKELEKDHLRKLEEEKQRERENDLEMERLRKLEEEWEREREREKDRMGVESKLSAASERAPIEARERAERAAVERAATEARQRAMTEARERLEKACAEAREKSLGKGSKEAQMRAERAAVERATAEARERAIEKAMAERATFETRERVERSTSEKFSSPYRNAELRHTSSSNDLWNPDKSDGVNCESPQRCKARLERHRRTVERVSKALAEKNMRDLIAQREQAERNRLAETLDADIKRWSNGKEGNLRALLSTLQYILGQNSGWHPVPLTEVITSAAVKKAYRKATLCVHPDKLQQRGASIQQKYICEKVFDLLKDAWNKFNSEER